MRLEFYTLLTRLTIFIHSQDTRAFTQQLLHYDRESITRSDMQRPVGQI